jgi:hypothetical protein
MKIDNNIKRALKDLKVSYTIEKSRDHYFIKVEGHPRIIIGGNHDRSKTGCVKGTVRLIKKLNSHVICS